MKKQIVILGIALLFVCVGLSGCEILEPKPDYITVTMDVAAGVSLRDKNNNPVSGIPISGITVRIDLIKDGGETLTFYRTTDDYGVCPPAMGSFKLYKEQPIVCIVIAEGVFQDFSPIGADSETLTWAQVSASTDIGGSFYYYFDMNAHMQNST